MQFEVLSNQSPYKRIEIGAMPKKPEPKWVPFEFNATVEWLVPGYVAPSVDVFGNVIIPSEDIYCG